MYMIRLDDRRAATTPLLVGSKKEVEKSLACGRHKHHKWEDLVGSDRPGPEGGTLAMQQCSCCIARRAVLEADSAEELERILVTTGAH